MKILFGIPVLALDGLHQYNKRRFIIPEEKLCLFKRLFVTICKGSRSDILTYETIVLQNVC
jgi:hypothetical protein